MRFITILAITLLLPISVFSQNSIAKIKFQQAEESYTNKDYPGALKFLDEAEKNLGQLTSTILYLRILSQDKIFNANPYGDYNLLSSLRENCSNYLKATDGNRDVEDKFAEVYFIQENLKKYPKSRTEFDMQLKQIEKQQAEEAQRIAKIEEENRRLQQEAELKKQEEQRLATEKELTKVGYTSLFVEYSMPKNKQSSSIISYDEWLASTSEQPFTTALKAGKFGLNGSVSLGFEGIAGFNKLNYSMKSSRLGFGFFWGVHHSWLFYNFNDIGNVPEIHKFYFEDYEKAAFMVTSLGLGPSLSYRLGKKRTFIDIHYSYNLNVFWGGPEFYSFDYYDSNLGSGSGTVKKEITTTAFSPVLGFSFRTGHIIVSYEIRFKVIDRGLYVDNFEYTDYSTFNTTHETQAFQPENGVDLSTKCLKFGIIF